jgi:hypothetical protein
MALGPAGQKQRRGKGVSIRRGHRDIVAKYVVQSRLGHCFFSSGCERPLAKAKSAFAARVCQDYRKSNWR